MTRSPTGYPARERLKAWAEVGLVASGLPALRRRLRRHERIVLAFHNVIPAEHEPAGDCSLHLPQGAFRRLLREVQATHDVIPLADLVNNVPVRRPLAAITFDDAYVGALTAGVAELRRAGVPATFFVCPGRLGGQSFWWDRLAAVQGELSDARRDDALTRWKGDEEAVMSGLPGDRIPAQTLPDWALTASVDLLHEGAKTSGFDFASHSWSHPNLSAIEPTRLQEEMARPLEWLRHSGLPWLPALAYPYGRSSPEVERAAVAAGYSTGLLIQGGGFQPAVADPMRWPRLNVPAGLSPEGLVLRMSRLVRG